MRFRVSKFEYVVWTFISLSNNEFNFTHMQLSNTCIYVVPTKSFKSNDKAKHYEKFVFPNSELKYIAVGA